MNQSWSIIVISYNEEETIAAVISQVLFFIQENSIPDFEIIVVDDGSTDNSENIINDLSGNYSGIKCIRHSENLGIGPALLTGYKNAVKENVVMIPADGQFNISELKEYKNFDKDTFLSFYREEMKDYSLFRKVVTGLNKLFNKYLLGLPIRDVNWVKAYKTKELHGLDLRLQSSLVGSEICAKLNVNGIKAKEILSVYHKRIAGKAKGASLKTLSNAVKELIKLTFIIRKYKKGINKD